MHASSPRAERARDHAGTDDALGARDRSTRASTLVLRPRAGDGLGHGSRDERGRRRSAGSQVGRRLGHQHRRTHGLGSTRRGRDRLARQLPLLERRGRLVRRPPRRRASRRRRTRSARPARSPPTSHATPPPACSPRPATRSRRRWASASSSRAALAAATAVVVFRFLEPAPTSEAPSPRSPTRPRVPRSPAAELKGAPDDHPGTINNLAARMGRWSARHRKIAIFGWLGLVVVAVLIGKAAGTIELKQNDAIPGESGRATRLIDSEFAPRASETVLVQSNDADRGRSCIPCRRRRRPRQCQVVRGRRRRRLALRARQRAARSRPTATRHS